MIAISIATLIVLLIDLALDAATSRLWIEFWGFKPESVMESLSDERLHDRNSELLSLFTALFSHTSGLHLAGNLAYLWVFGIPVERGIGPIRFLMIFLILGAFANLFVALQIPDLDRYIIGSSGGVSAIIGAYLGLFPTRRIGLWLPLGLFLQFARIPALLVIGSWFTLQLLYTVFGPMSGAVAWWTHVAGFVAGLAAAVALRLISGRITLDRED
ncbi:MAG: rhomboid family intramembrane serine protease [Wenzhouxiangellaceae bacterium]